ncbi:MAG: VWA domain-containing protein [Chloroflexi bacterium]|nr:MAG: VWA domain-containing protein [Chloroflexota bacterium]
MKIALAHPELAPLLIAAVLIVALCAVALVRRRRALAAFAGPGARLASASPARQVAKVILVGGACLLVVVALVGPQIGEVPRRAATSTLDTIIALDVSQSMAVRDADTDRLHAAQRAIELLGQQLSGGRVGLTLFAGSSILRYPLTASTKLMGPALDTSGHGFHTQPGSSLRAALQGAAAQFPTTDAEKLRTKAIVVVSDGEDPAPDLPPLDSYLASGIHVFRRWSQPGRPLPVLPGRRLRPARRRMAHQRTPSHATAPRPTRRSRAASPRHRGDHGPAPARGGVRATGSDRGPAGYGEPSLRARSRRRRRPVPRPSGEASDRA